MLKKAISLTFIFSLAVLFSVTLVMSGPPSIQWDKEEGAEDVEEYATDSGSFNILDGLEFTDIYVYASVYDGDGGGSDDMTAVAHIEISSGPTIHDEAEANGSDDDYDGAYDLEGNGYDGSSWYWSVDTRNNGGEGTALCKWAWNQE